MQKVNFMTKERKIETCYVYGKLGYFTKDCYSNNIVKRRLSNTILRNNIEV